MKTNKDRGIIIVTGKNNFDKLQKLIEEKLDIKKENIIIIDDIKENIGIACHIDHSHTKSCLTATIIESMKSSKQEVQTLQEIVENQKLPTRTLEIKNITMPFVEDIKLHKIPKNNFVNFANNKKKNFKNKRR